jgi:hypothetical protein
MPRGIQGFQHIFDDVAGALGLLRSARRLVPVVLAIAIVITVVVIAALALR